MDTYMRAAQFAPFSALTGYEERIYETSRETDKKIILDENQKEEINYRLSYVLENEEDEIPLIITHFVSDKTKSGGKYITTCDYIKKYDSIRKSVITSDGTEICIDDILSVDYQDKGL